jgi:hypothetical protein
MNHDTLVEIFFTITGVAVIIIAVLLTVIGVYLISIFRTVRRIVETAEFATEVVKEDLAELRQNIKQRGFSLSAFLKFFKDMGRKRILPRRKK